MIEESQREGISYGNNREGYVPIGYLHASMPRAPEVDHVLINGEPCTHVIQADDVEGWAERFVPDPNRPGHFLEAASGDGCKTEIVRGDIRFVWRAVP